MSPFDTTHTISRSPCTETFFYMFGAPPLHLNFSKIFSNRKLESLDHCSVVRMTMFSVLLEHGLVRDRQTDRAVAYAALA